MKVYEVKRNNITILLANDELPKEGDVVTNEWEVAEPTEETISEGDYLLHFENGEWNLKKVE